MAKAARQKIKLESTAGTGYFYVTTKQTQSQEKIEVKKYDPKVRNTSYLSRNGSVKIWL